MTVWRITGFDDEGPHGEIALIEADSAEAAADLLASRIEDEQGRPDTVWGVSDRKVWRISEFSGEFILGAGCR